MVDFFYRYDILGAVRAIGSSVLCLLQTKKPLFAEVVFLWHYFFNNIKLDMIAMIII